MNSLKINFLVESGSEEESHSRTSERCETALLHRVYDYEYVYFLKRMWEYSTTVSGYIQANGTPIHKVLQLVFLESAVVRNIGVESTSAVFSAQDYF